MTDPASYRAGWMAARERAAEIAQERARKMSEERDNIPVNTSGRGLLNSEIRWVVYLRDIILAEPVPEAPAGEISDDAPAIKNALANLVRAWEVGEDVFSAILDARAALQAAALPQAQPASAEQKTLRDAVSTVAELEDRERELMARVAALEAENARMREALGPFAQKAWFYDPPEDDDDNRIWDTRYCPTLGDLRRARAALSAAGEAGHHG